ncbi:helix-turn-helix transcriptional regulator [Lactobacillus acetotolerans]|uniref:helix-turn-helix domain-containing protein n=1 Tax=Lactobacillus acetotolerans TaxID=1600 RepID=UPI002FD998B7
MTIKLGTIIKLKRNEKGFSQKELVNNICAQSMLSAIENNKYVPNAQLSIGHKYC